MDFDSTAPVLESVLRHVESLPSPLDGVVDADASGDRRCGAVHPGCDAAGLRDLLELGEDAMPAARWTSYASSACAAGALEPGDGLWTHLAGVACAAVLIARQLESGGITAARAYLGGLLHDVGKIALRQVFPRAYARTVREARRTRGDIAECERAVFGTDHTVAGRRLAERWHLPSDLADTIWLHHVAAGTLPASMGSGRLLMVVQLADTLVREQHVGDSGNFAFYERAAEIGARLGIDAARLDVIAGRLPALAGELSRLCGRNGVPSPTQPPTADAPVVAIDLTPREPAGERFLSAYEKLGEALHVDRHLNDVIRASAAVLAELLRVERACVFALLDAGLRAQVAVSGGEETFVRDVDAAGLAAESAPEWRPVPEKLAGVVAGIDDLCGGRWIALRCGDELVGGLIVPAAAAGVWPGDRSEPGHMAALARWVANLIHDARTRGVDRRLAEDLADSNRRLQQTQRQVLQRRTLSMIAEMAAGAAHELNGPLTVISGRAQMLKSAATDPEAVRALETIHLRAHECSRIVSELMDFAQPRPPRPEPVDVVRLVAAVAGEFNRGSGAAVRVHVPPGTERIAARMDPGQIGVVLRELLDNAGAAVRDTGGQISINCRERGTDDTIEITVRDGGMGMAPGVLQRAFDPFFSFHRAGRRRGLGLARALRIVEAHGGRIWIDSRPGAGTSVHVLVPRGEPRGASGRPDLGANTGPG